MVRVAVTNLDLIGSQDNVIGQVVHDGPDYVRSRDGIEAKDTNGALNDLVGLVHFIQIRYLREHGVHNFTAAGIDEQYFVTVKKIGWHSLRDLKCSYNWL